MLPAFSALRSSFGHQRVRHDAVAGGADSRRDRRRDDEGVARSHVLPVGDTVHVCDERGENREVDAQTVADAGDRLAPGHGVGHQVEGEHVAAAVLVGTGVGADRAGLRGCGRNAGGGSAGGGDAGGGGVRYSRAASRVGRDHLRVRVACRQIQRPADGQLAPLSVVDVVEGHDCVLAGVIVQTQSLADPQYIVALRHGVLNNVGAIRSGGCACGDGHARKQGHHHQYRKQHTNDPFLHSCSP